jgi:hypothetical protein
MKVLCSPGSNAIMARAKVCVGAFGVMLGLCEPALAQSRAVSIAYRAPNECPSEAAFVREVLRRLSAVRVTDAADAERHFVVDVQSTSTDGRARLEFVDAEGSRVERELSARNCREAANGIALVTAVAIDPRLSIADEPPEERHETEPTRASEPTSASEPTPRQTARQTTRATSQNVDSLPSRSKEVDRAGWPWLAGVAGGVVSDVAPVWAATADAFAEAGPTRSFRGRLTLGYSDTGQFDLQGGLARFQLGFARTELCPVAIRVANAIAFRPCAGVEAGALRAEGGASPRLAEPKSTPLVPWFAGIAALRAELELGSIFSTELEGQLRVPFLHHRYVFERPEQVVFETPDFGAGLLVGARARFGDPVGL